jgi:uncharacterized protein (TIGR02246 family)
MFERFTERARRVIFFARYEASQYGSPFIETEHLLLGLLREDGLVVLRFLRPKTTAAEFRTQIESLITAGERISTAVEVPLTIECQRILTDAKEKADDFGSPYIGTEHLLLGILASPTTLAARLLMERGADANAIREQIAKTSGSGGVKEGTERAEKSRRSKLLGGALFTLERFLAGIKTPDWGRRADSFAGNSEFIDSAGKRWAGREEIRKKYEILFAPYAKKNAIYRVESCELGPGETVLGSILWENVTVEGQPLKSLHRMTVMLARQDEDWLVHLLQVTPVTM